jgi:hypothetical protein
MNTLNPKKKGIAVRRIHAGPYNAVLLAACMNDSIGSPTNSIGIIMYGFSLYKYVTFAVAM